MSMYLRRKVRLLEKRIEELHLRVQLFENISKRKRKGAATVSEEVEAEMRKILSSGPVLARTVLARLSSYASRPTILKVKAQMGVKSKRAKGTKKAWTWELPLVTRVFYSRVRDCVGKRRMVKESELYEALRRYGEYTDEQIEWGLRNIGSTPIWNEGEYYRWIDQKKLYLRLSTL